jgi:hypothetical protein
MMEYKRGWCPMELAYSNLLQANLVHPGGPLLNLELPLIFLDRSDPELPRTVWDALRDQSKFHHPSDGDAIPWAVDQIVAFLHREQKLALDMAKVVAPGTPLFESLNGRDGLVRRITQFDPGPIP